MSTVITVVTENVVVQVSDVRLTSLDDGKPLDEKQRKSALVVGTEAAFVIGWRGFAKSSNKEFKTGDWLFRTLNHIKAYEKPLVDILGDLTGQADYAFNHLPDPQAIKGFSLRPRRLVPEERKRRVVHRSHVQQLDSE